MKLFNDGEADDPESEEMLRMFRRLCEGAVRAAAGRFLGVRDATTLRCASTQFLRL